MEVNMIRVNRHKYFDKDDTDGVAIFYFIFICCQWWLKRPIHAVKFFHYLSYRGGAVSGSSWRKGETTLAFSCPPSSALVYSFVSFSVFPQV